LVIVGDEISMEIGGPRVVEEHQWTTGKLVQVLVEAEEVRCGLPTGVQCAAGAEEDGGGGMQLGRSKLGSGSNRIGRVC
jgi:hypothetical protein